MVAIILFIAASLLAMNDISSGLEAGVVLLSAIPMMRAMARRANPRPNNRRCKRDMPRSRSMAVVCTVFACRSHARRQASACRCPRVQKMQIDCLLLIASFLLQKGTDSRQCLPAGTFSALSAPHQHRNTTKCGKLLASLIFPYSRPRQSAKLSIIRRIVDESKREAQGVPSASLNLHDWSRKKPDGKRFDRKRAY